MNVCFDFVCWVTLLRTALESYPGHQRHQTFRCTVVDLALSFERKYWSSAAWGVTMGFQGSSKECQAISSSGLGAESPAVQKEVKSFVLYTCISISPNLEQPSFFD